MDVVPVPVRRLPTPLLSPAQVAEAQGRLVQAVADYAIIMLDPAGHVLSWNAGAAAIKGYAASEILGRHFSVFYTPEAIAVGHPERELEIAAVSGRYDEEGWRVRKNQTRFWAKVQILSILDDDGRLVAFGKVTTDLTAQRQQDEQAANMMSLLEKSIRIDYLTGLPNRKAWDERLAEEMDKARRHDTSLVVCLLDLDFFKAYNDASGHLAGDHLLKRAAIGWRQVLRPGDVLARYGGEEFVLALPGCALPEAEEVVNRLLAVMPYGQTCSAGVSLWDGVEPADRILDRADSAMYLAKAAGRNRVHVA